MPDTYYILTCWLHHRKGVSFIVEMREKDGVFQGVRQDESNGIIQSIRTEGRIDFKQPISEFKISDKTVASIFKGLEELSLPVSPPLGGGFDGASYHLRLKNGENLSHFSWWLDCPPAWAPVQIVWDQLVGLSHT
jgi:hypothetical protein